ncbi:terpene synthase family protein [Kitasatospora purpeofusca]|uniref:terpene synthase family protein n=1 Tax=Kitasatospora purpeofusca TaxID=67352 RepID=UPI0033F42E62
MDELQVESEAWAQGWGLDLVDGEFARTRCGWLAAHVYPLAERPLLQLAADLIGWLFLFDDYEGEARDAVRLKRTSESCLHILRTGALPEEPHGATRFEHALVDLRGRLLGLSDDAFVLQFARSMAKFHAGWLMELPYRLCGSPPTLDTYRRIRPWSIGIHTVFDLLEISTGRPREETRERLEDLYNQAGLAAGLCNDIHSFAKERDANDPMNIIIVLAYEYGQSLADAAQTAATEYEFQLTRLEEMCAQVSEEAAFTRPEALIAQGLRIWVHGATAWTSTCGRYHA